MEFLQLTNQNEQQVTEFIQSKVNVERLSKCYSKDKSIKQIDVRFTHKAQRHVNYYNLTLYVDDFIIFDKESLMAMSENILNEYKEQKAYNFEQYKNKQYYIIDEYGNIKDYYNDRNQFDEMHHNNINYFPDRETTLNFHKVQLLQRKLLKFALENNDKPIDFNDVNQKKYTIMFDKEEHVPVALQTKIFTTNETYFTSEDIANKAIDTFYDEIREVYNLKW